MVKYEFFKTYSSISNSLRYGRAHGDAVLRPAQTLTGFIGGGIKMGQDYRRLCRVYWRLQFVSSSLDKN